MAKSAPLASWFSRVTNYDSHMNSVNRRHHLLSIVPEFALMTSIVRDLILLMSHRPMNRYRVPAKWITVDFVNGLCAYFQLNASGSLKHMRSGIPIPRFITHSSRFSDSNECCSLLDSSDEWTWDDSDMFSQTDLSSTMK
jgi:hypothetical protein